MVWLTHCCTARLGKAAATLTAKSMAGFVDESAHWWGSKRGYVGVCTANVLLTNLFKLVTDNGAFTDVLSMLSSIGVWLLSDYISKRVDRKVVECRIVIQPDQNTDALLLQEQSAFTGSIYFRKSPPIIIADAVCHHKGQLVAVQCVERLPGSRAGCTGRCDRSAGAGPSMHSVQLCPAVLQGLPRSADPQDCSRPVGTRADSSGQKPAGKGPRETWGCPAWHPTCKLHQVKSARGHKGLVCLALHSQVVPVVLSTS